MKFDELAVCQPNLDFIKDVLTFDVRDLESATPLFISQSVIALSQYLIYVKYNTNLTKAELTREQQILEGSIFELLTDDMIKKMKTKKDARQWLINNNAFVAAQSQKVDSLYAEVYAVDGIDKQVSEYVAAFKRELTRREHEYYQQSITR